MFKNICRYNLYTTKYKQLKYEVRKFSSKLLEVIVIISNNSFYET